MRKDEQPPRLHKTGDNYYWKPERALRPRWKSAALGPDPRLAKAEALRLNRAVADWKKAQADGAPALKRRERLGPSTVGQLISKYKQSEDWRALKPRTILAYTYEFTRLEAEFGHEIAATLGFARVDDWLEALRRTSPATARNVLAKGRLLFSWAQRKELIPSGVNPFKEQRRVRRKEKAHSQGGRRTARLTWDEVKTIVAGADAAGLPSIGTALVIGFACVQRITDVIGLRKIDIIGGRLKFKQGKTGFPVDMALPAIVAERLAAAPPLLTEKGWLVVSEETRTAYHEKTISRVYARLRAALIASGATSLAGKQLRDCRRSGFVHYVLDDVPIPLVTSMSGHSIEEGMGIVEHYLPKTADQADRAVAKLSVKWG